MTKGFMGKLFCSLFIVTLLSACATSYYGYTKEEWDKLSPERQQEAKAGIKEMKDREYNRDLEYKKLNDLFGTISNQF